MPEGSSKYVALITGSKRMANANCETGLRLIGKAAARSCRIGIDHRL